MLLATTLVEARSLSKQIRSLSESARQTTKRQRDGGLSARQCLVLLTVYILSGCNAAVAIEFYRSRKRGTFGCDATDEDIAELTENLYLGKTVEALTRLEEPGTTVHREAARFLADRDAHNFVRDMNRRGAAPATEAVAEQYVTTLDRL